MHDINLTQMIENLLKQYSNKVDKCNLSRHRVRVNATYALTAPLGLVRRLPGSLPLLILF